MGVGATYQRELKKKKRKVEIGEGSSNFYTFLEGPCARGISKWGTAQGTCRAFTAACLPPSRLASHQAGAHSESQAATASRQA